MSYRAKICGMGVNCNNDSGKHQRKEGNSKVIDVKYRRACFIYFSKHLNQD